jgi:Flp pilus assembly protein TadG
MTRKTAKIPAQEMRIPKDCTERGSALIEHGFVLIILLLFIFGIIDFGRALFSYHFVANAAREATRYAIVRGASCSLPDDCPATSAGIQSYVQSTATGAGITTANLSVIPQWSVPNYDAGTQVITCTQGAGGLYNNPGCMVSVQVQYAFKAIFPFFPTSTCTIGRNTVQASICMKSSSEMVISQ